MQTVRDLTLGQWFMSQVNSQSLTNPEVLLLDEPTEGIQPNIIDLTGKTLLKIKREGEITMLHVEQYVDFALAVADQFYIMDRGAIVKRGAIAELTEVVVRHHLTV